MSIGVGGDRVGQDVTAGVTAQPGPEWPARVVAAFGGAVVVVWLVMLGATWEDGLRPTTLESLRTDLANGTVLQWYAASSLDDGPLELARALPSGTSGGSGESGEPGDHTDGSYRAPEGFPEGGLLVWRTSGQPGWWVATNGGVPSGETSARASEETTELIRQLRAAEVPMTSSELGDRSTLDGVYGLGAVVLLGRLVLGPPTRVGTRWFWFWLFVGAPLALGALAYAVTELIGLRRRPDPPLDRRLRGITGFGISVLLSFAAGALAVLLRSRGVPLPL